MSFSEGKYALMRAGREALRRGDAEAAREHFEQATAAEPSNAEAWFGLAQAFRALKNAPGASAAIERTLALEPRSFRALVLRGDLYAEDGNGRAASSFYAAAVRSAPPQGQLTAQLSSELRRAQDMCERYAREYESFLRERLIANGLDPAHSSGRFAQSLDLMMGRKKIFLQQPVQYYLPELPQIQFYERKNFPWLDAVEAATDDIVAELHGVMKNESEFKPYVERIPDRPRPTYGGMTESMDWSAFFLWRNGEAVPENAARCPKTIAALKNVPHSVVPGRMPSILFSQLRAGARIPPHNGFVNTRLICHLPLIVPEKCGFRVGNEARTWEKGKAWVFDDTIEHEAWNNSRETRVILLFEIWRPELTETERQLVATLIDAIDAYRGERVPWNS